MEEIVTLLRNPLTAVLILILGLSFACSKNKAIYRQAARDYKSGELAAALENSVILLQRKPSHAKAQKLIKKAYSGLLAEGEERLAQIQAENPEDIWDRLVDEYRPLVGYQDLVRTVDPLVDPKTGEKYNFEFRDYGEKLTQSRLEAAENHYQKGLAILAASEAPDSQRAAAREFQIVVEYVPAYRDAAERLATARVLAIKRVAVMVFEDKSGTRNKYGSLIDLLTDAIIAKLVQDDTVRQYIDIVSRDQVYNLINERQFAGDFGSEEERDSELGRFLGAHEIMTGKIIQVNYVPERVSDIELKETKNMVTGKEKYTTDKGKERERDVKEDVTCGYKKYTKTASVRIIASFNLIEVETGKVKYQDTVTSEYAWTDTWGRVVNGGDERALSEQTLAFVRKEEPFPPSEADMVSMTLDKISDEILIRVRAHVQ